MATEITNVKIVNSTLDASPIGSATPSSAIFTTIACASIAASGLVSGGSLSISGAGAVGGGLTVNGGLDVASGLLTAAASVNVTGGNISVGAGNISVTAGTISASGNVSSGATVSGANVTATGTVSAPNGAFSSSLTAPTVAESDNSTHVATTAWSVFGFAISLAATGYIKFPAWLSGFTIQWGTCGTFDTGPQTVAFPLTFANACLQVIVCDNQSSASRRIWAAGSYSTGSFSAQNDGSGTGQFIAVGY